ncbi:hypothetical protein CHS0354_026273 [Potamilus streckersoni]|uniref:EF-hand domain-containing protein n=1 Tax=Potamilus streckersoni TaxID=2493646 RepID=A0AAE0W5L6_9BIVA|nr:hypothetical protein CHS0354_026273 [Potamilus streckersoni]
MGHKQSKMNEKEVKKLSKICDMSPAEIREWHKDFKRLLKGGRYLTPQNFKQVYNEMFHGDATHFAENVFRTFDIDGNGKVDFKEFLIGLSITASSNVEKRLRWAFKMYDVDGSGTISRQEMCSIVQAVYTMTAISQQNTIPPQKLADDLFSKLDTDNNGEITWEEFRDGALNDETLLRLLQIDPEGGDE